MTSKKIKIKVKKPYIAYPGTPIQQGYGEDVTHGYLLWDLEKDKHDVTFHELPNPKPYVTFDWQGSVQETLEFAKQNFKLGSRFRVYSKQHIPQKDVVNLTSSLRDTMQASEVTYKIDHYTSKNTISVGSTNLAKDNIRNTDVLIKLLKDYHTTTKVTNDTWNSVQENVKSYLSQIEGELCVRNTKWSLRNLKFDNTFGYGSDNVINFDNMNGITGIFGPNRSGKSSIVGTIMYALFNGTDRGSIKNLHVINARKPFCYTRALVNINGVDYVIERQTTKNETKKGQVFASTALNVFMMKDDEAIDLAGEQRTDTEKIVRNLIGTPDDFLLTSLSAQDEIKLFITQGTTKRRQILARFLDLDVFDKMYDLAKNELNTIKSALKMYPDKDWDSIEKELIKKLNECGHKFAEKSAKADETLNDLDTLRSELSTHTNITPVSEQEVEKVRLSKKSLIQKIKNEETEIQNLNDSIEKLTEKLVKTISFIRDSNIVELQNKQNALKTLSVTVSTLKHGYEKELSILTQQLRSLKILDTVPCGEQFPLCVYIKDAHVSKSQAPNQQKLVDESLATFESTQKAYDALKIEDVDSQIDKYNQIVSLKMKLETDKKLKSSELNSHMFVLSKSKDELVTITNRLITLEASLKNHENNEVAIIKAKINSLNAFSKSLDNEKLALASENGKLKTNLENHKKEREIRETMMQKMHAHELIANAFSKKAIPSTIISSQLPLINAEISKILSGIVDFNVELETDDENDSMEIYINYGDSKRIIELGSGMEKMIASIAIRVALINVSSLPKTNMFMIDEGFGALDDVGVETCNRLLISLKRMFKNLIVITHVEGVKDVADMIIDVTKNEKDSKVVFE